MKKILCYGDSNTYGYIPGSGARFPENVRWSGLLKELLPEYTIIEEGMNNRTGFFKNPMGLKQSGGEYLSVYLQNHRDIDICIISLGTNDAQLFYDLDHETVISGISSWIKSLKEANSKTKIIITAPVKISENILNSGFAIMFNEDSIQKINQVFPTFKDTAEKNSCYYIDFNEFATPSSADGLHYDEFSHKIIAQKFAEFIRSKF